MSGATQMPSPWPPSRVGPAALADRASGAACGTHVAAAMWEACGFGEHPIRCGSTSGSPSTVRRGICMGRNGAPRCLPRFVSLKSFFLLRREIRQTHQHECIGRWLRSHVLVEEVAHVMCSVYKQVFWGLDYVQRFGSTITW
jgi:hypothetical protein